MDADGMGTGFVGWLRSGRVAPQGASALAECRPLTESAAPVAWNRSGPLLALSDVPPFPAICRFVAVSLCRTWKLGTGYGAAPHVGRSAAAAAARARCDDLVAPGDRERTQDPIAPP